MPAKYGIELPDRQLACAPVDSPEGQQYLGAMRAAANYAWANRQLLMWQAREVFAEFFGQSWESLGMNLVYDVAHNIAKMEEHTVDGKQKTVCVHRKGATRAFPPGHPEVPDRYRADRPAGDHPRRHGPRELGPGRPAGQHGAVRSARTCHGAGRVMSRTAAIQHAQGRRIDQELADAGRHRPVPKLEGAGRRAARRLQRRQSGGRRGPPRRPGQKVARLRPIGVVKG